MVAVLPVDKEQYSYSKWLLWSSNLRTAYGPTNTLRPNHVIDSCGGSPILGPYMLVTIHFVLIMLLIVVVFQSYRTAYTPTNTLRPNHVIDIVVVFQSYRTAYAPTNTRRCNHVIDSCGVPMSGPHMLVPIHFVLILLLI